jgi:hypothetical protein
MRPRPARPIPVEVLRTPSSVSPRSRYRIRIKVTGNKIDETGLKFIVSPYDEYALEEAIRVKEKSPGDVTVITFGPERAQRGLREARARCDEGAARQGESGDADALGIAKVLAAAIKSYRTTSCSSANRASAPTTVSSARWSRSSSAIRRSTS